jgi:hypothetical protein
MEKINMEDEFNTKIQEYINQNNELTIKLTEQLKLNDKNEDMIAQLKSENAHLKLLVNNAGAIIKTSVSTMSYVIKNYKDAPALETIKDYSAIHYEKNNDEFVEELVHQHDHQKLSAYIGDFIIKNYKKQDPSKQSIWNSDTNRLTYMIKELLNNKKVDWKIDKKGIKTTKYIIEPILDYIDPLIREYIENFDIDYNLYSSTDAQIKMMKLKSATEILGNIEDRLLCDEILKYIAPHFYLSKNEE